MVTLTVVIVAVVVLIIANNSSNATRTVHNGPDKTKLTSEQSRGRRLFASTCASCHTLAAANAVGKVGPNLDQLRPPAALVATIVTNGLTAPGGVMPAGLLTGPDVRAVADFVAAVTRTPDKPTPSASGSSTATQPSAASSATTAPSTTTQPGGAATSAGTTPAAPAAGDATAGRSVFADNCSVCHGVTGHGGNGGPDLTTMPLARTVAGVTRQVTDGGGGMPPFRGQLSDKQIADVAAYVTTSITGGR
jgi:mono/diheme cytochrome c family protein